jgi:2-polyprenyl-3-methyl-5-hydroxy-6-metoxy-1,4-benzoquinol methylase
MSRFPKVEGLDYKRGAVEYTDKIGARDLDHLYTKPFYNLSRRHARYEGAGLDADTHRHFCDFANMVNALALPAGAKVLDVGCGSGWLSEWLARLGYDVTGMDISPALIEISRQRVGNLPYRVDGETPLKCRFVAQDVETAPLPETFDAAVCYDSLHHFDDENAVLRHISAMLRPGGQLFIMEGERPPDDSQTAQELTAAMREYATLEAPFSRAYLLELLDAQGFAVVADYVSVNGLFPRNDLRDNSLPVAPEPVNYLLCKKVAENAPASSVPDSRQPSQLSARFEVLEWTERVKAGDNLRLRFRVTNTGDTLWLVQRSAPRGTVRLGVKILDAAGATLEEFHGKPLVHGAMAPGETAELLLEHPAPRAAGAYTLEIDLLDQEICWFAQNGSQVLSLPFIIAA